MKLILSLEIQTNIFLYNLNEDKKQQINLALKMPEKLKEMIQSFEKIRGTDYKDIESLELK